MFQMAKTPALSASSDPSTALNTSTKGTINERSETLRATHFIASESTEPPLKVHKPNTHAKTIENRISNNSSPKEKLKPQQPIKKLSDLFKAKKASGNIQATKIQAPVIKMPPTVAKLPERTIRENQVNSETSLEPPQNAKNTKIDLQPTVELQKVPQHTHSRRRSSGNANLFVPHKINTLKALFRDKKTPSKKPPLNGFEDGLEGNKLTKGPPTIASPKNQSPTIKTKNIPPKKPSSEIKPTHDSQANALNAELPFKMDGNEKSLEKLKPTSRVDERTGSSRLPDSKTHGSKLAISSEPTKTNQDLRDMKTPTVLGPKVNETMVKMAFGKIVHKERISSKSTLASKKEENKPIDSENGSKSSKGTSENQITLSTSPLTSQYDHDKWVSENVERKTYLSSIATHSTKAHNSDTGRKSKSLSNSFAKPNDEREKIPSYNTDINERYRRKRGHLAAEKGTISQKTQNVSLDSRSLSIVSAKTDATTNESPERIENGTDKIGKKVKTILSPKETNDEDSTEDNDRYSPSDNLVSVKDNNSDDSITVKRRHSLRKKIVVDDESCSSKASSDDITLNKIKLANTLEQKRPNNVTKSPRRNSKSEAKEQQKIEPLSEPSISSERLRHATTTALNASIIDRSVPAKADLISGFPNEMEINELKTKLATITDEVMKYELKVAS